jgi:hypothetical protein
LHNRLWTEHLTAGNDLLNNCVELNSFDEGFDAWRAVASYNGARILRGERIRGHIHYHNFEEMKCPPPYAKAIGCDKFKLF